jgi:hypothetical protein
MTNLKPTYNSELQCSVFGLNYDFTARTGVLRMEEGNACDMAGCISLFTRIDSGAKAIQTMAGDIDDTAYRLVGKEWKASLPSRE